MTNKQLFMLILMANEETIISAHNQAEAACKRCCIDPNAPVVIDIDHKTGGFRVT